MRTLQYVFLVGFMCLISLDAVIAAAAKQEPKTVVEGKVNKSLLFDFQGYFLVGKRGAHPRSQAATCGYRQGCVVLDLLL
ncbi:MAG: hypothetical protein ACWGQW_07355 [bacterium]